MAERAAHLVDHVFPTVPVRQWVLTFPHRLRYRLAWDHDLCNNAVRKWNCINHSRFGRRRGGAVTEGLGSCYRLTSSTRRFLARPASASLDATGA
jgi:hypothetical protein